MPVLKRNLLYIKAFPFPADISLFNSLPSRMILPCLFCFLPTMMTAATTRTETDKNNKSQFIV